MKIERVIVGELDTNCYLVSEGNTAVVIDPGDEAGKIFGRLGDRQLAAILLTHGHFDHIGGVSKLKKMTGAQVYMHETDVPMVTDRSKSLGIDFGFGTTPFEVDKTVNDGDELNFGGMNFKVMHTPGHSGGGVIYAVGGVVFGGDLIFKCSIGRYDHGDFADEMASIERVLGSFPDETVIYPGHGPETTVGYEKKYNPYIRR